MNHIYIRYRDVNGCILDHPEPDSEILIYDAGQYDTLYIHVGEMRNGVPYLNHVKYWDLNYYEREFPEDKLLLIKESLLDLVVSEFCTGMYMILEETERHDWLTKYNELKQRLTSS